MLRYLVFYVVIIVAFMSTGCTTLVEKGGRVLDGSAFAEKTLSVYRSKMVEVRQTRNRDKQELLLITLNDFPYLKIRATTAEQNGTFLFTSRYFLGGTLSGWNEWTQEIVGNGTFRITGNIAYLNIRDTLAAGDIVNGKILHNSSKRTGDEALSTLRFRSERIDALVEWMHTSVVPDLPDEGAFSAYWKPILLPELVRAKERPSAYAESLDEGNAEWEVAEDVKWNKAYTRYLFPEELQVLRDSGSLLRDWEEALSWIYFIYKWEYIEGMLKEVILIKK
jgi:hypothetical protein